MNVFAEQSRSLWMLPQAIDAPRLEADRRADVLVIGSGIAGLSCAYELALAGRNVTVVDRGPIARGMTARTSAHLAYELDDYYHELIKLRDLEEARQYYRSQSAAVDRIEAIAREERIDCDFRRVDAYLYASRPQERSVLESELDACNKVGFDGVAWSRVPGLAHEALRFPQQARFHPVRYIDGLARALIARGGVLYANSAVVDFDERRDEVEVTFANGAHIVAAAVVVASNSPISNRVAVHTKQAPYRTYVIAAPVPSGSVADALIWDTADPYHYVRLQPAEGRDYIIVGGEDHKTGTEDDGRERVARLHAWTRERWPSVGAIEYAWSGQIYEPVDAVPYIGRAPGKKHIYLVTGDSGEGLTTGAAAGLILHELVMGREHPWASVYDPERKTLRSVKSYLQENLGVAANMTEHVHDSEQLSALDDVASGTGAVVSLDGRKVAAYRGEDGEVQLRSASCTHVGCVVHWNSFERCWDCPCHGSQFSVEGEPLTGPAMKPLAPVDREFRHLAPRPGTHSSRSPGPT